jgi:hypothetical protein
LTQKCFGKNLEQKAFFGGIFGRSAEMSAAERQMKFQKLNIFGNFSNFLDVFLQIGPEHGRESQKNIKKKVQSLKQYLKNFKKQFH